MTRIYAFFLHTWCTQPMRLTFLSTAVKLETLWNSKFDDKTAVKTSGKKKNHFISAPVNMTVFKVLKIAITNNVCYYV